MSGFYVLAVPEFASLIDAAVKSGAGKVHPPRGHYQFVEFESEIEIWRRDTRMNEAVWYGCLTGGLDGKIAHFDSDRLKLVATNEPILGVGAA
jgi:hypothetical protein